MRTNKRYRLFATGLFLLCSAAIMAQPQQEMSSTSVMLQNDNASYSTRNTEAVMSSGSAYSPEVDAPYESSPAPSGPRRVDQGNKPEGPFDDPLGDALLPLLLCAGAFLIIRVARRKRANE